MCNGFADECRPSAVEEENVCDCQYNTEGPRCNRCKEGFIQKKWKMRTYVDKFECESMLL